MASVETQELFEKLKDRMINIVNLSSRLASFVSWLPMEIENNILVDSAVWQYIYRQSSSGLCTWRSSFEASSLDRPWLMWIPGSHLKPNWLSMGVNDPEVL